MSIAIRDLLSFDDLAQVQSLEKQIWRLSDQDVMPLTAIIALKESGNIWLGAFDGSKMVGFAFGFLGREKGRWMLHSHMLGVLPEYRDRDVGHTLKLAQRERALSMGIQAMTWTFDPLQAKNAHLNFSKLGVVSDRYKADFYGPETSSVLHRNSTDRLWVEWRLSSRRVRQHLQGNSWNAEAIDVLSRLIPLVQFDASGRPRRTELREALARQRLSIEIPTNINALEGAYPELAREWRSATRWAFGEALGAGFFVAEFCRSVRGHQGPGAYLLQQGTLDDFVPEY